MNLSEIRKHYVSEGYSALNASARTCQDVVLAKIAASPFKENVTVKRGVLMCALSGSKRRATQDIDLDFVRYPISDEAIRSFVRTLSTVDDGIASWVEEWRVTVSSAAELLEIQHGTGAPIVIDGSRITVMAREA